MAKKDYVIVSAPNTDILEMLVEGYIGDGLTPIGGVTVDSTGATPVYMQAMHRVHVYTEDQSEDWAKGMAGVKF